MPAEVVTEPEKPVISPLYTRYQRYRNEHPNAVIVIRVGDFYEIFGDAVKTTSAPLDLTVVSRDFGLSERVPMIGFPDHRADTYIEKLRGFTDVAVIESDTEQRLLPKYLPVEGFEVDTTTGEIIEPEQAPDPYADTELMYKLYMLLDQKVEIVK
jgi:DNA mismatch repair protein MutS